MDIDSVASTLINETTFHGIRTRAHPISRRFILTDRQARQVMERVISKVPKLKIAFCKRTSSEVEFTVR